MRIKIVEIGLISSFCHFYRVVWGGGNFCGGFKIGRRSRRRGIFKEERFLYHLTEKKHLAFMLSLDGGDGYGDYRRYRTSYRLLNREIYVPRACDNFFKTGNCLRKRVGVDELGAVIKTRRSGFGCSCYFFREVWRQKCCQISNSEAINQVLEGRIDARSFLMIRVVLELADSMSKAFGFYWRVKKSQIVEVEKEKPKKNKNYIQNRWALALCDFIHEKLDSAINLSGWQFSKW